VLHQRLELPNARPWRAPAFLAQQAQRLGFSWTDADDVFLHCDYSPVNLLVNRDDRMAVIDASPNRYFTDHACLKGHRLVDVASYTAKLSWPYRLRSHTTAWRKMAATLRRRFIDVYERTSGASIDQTLLRMFESAVIRSFVEWKTTSRLLRSAAILVDRVGLHRLP
jgi:aminoglycoside phosphotransferase (APT) family kinase protein